MKTTQLLPAADISSTTPSLRLGLCCLFKDEAVSFRAATAKNLLTLPRDQQLRKLSETCLHNTHTLLLALEKARGLGIGAFRIMSPLFPRITHPEIGYTIDHLPGNVEIQIALAACKTFARKQQIRLSFHPDQFIVLSSPHPEVVANSILELKYQAQLAEAVGADVINIHAGGVYGDKASTLRRFGEVYEKLPESVRNRLTIENDDISYTPEDLLPLCERHTIPLVYDVHHHRCNPDNLTIEEATEQAGDTWQMIGQEQFCHLSSPRTGWESGEPRAHADYIDPNDIPRCWLERKMTVDVEAKAKEMAILRLMKDIETIRK